MMIILRINNNAQYIVNKMRTNARKTFVWKSQSQLTYEEFLDIFLIFQSDLNIQIKKLFPKIVR